MIALDLKKNALSDKGWVFYGDDVKFTSNRKLIAEEVERIYKKRIWIEMRFPGYKSAPTLIMSVKEDEIELERPSDWNQEQEVVLLQYRAPREPWHSIKTRLKKASGDSLFFYFPEIYAVSERRSYFRVETPAGSTAKIMLKKQSSSTTSRKRARHKFFMGIIKDISVGGISIYPQKMPGVILPASHIFVGPLELDLKINEKKTWPLMEIKKAEVVRLSETMLNDKKILEMAFKFHMNRSEEENLVNYIRQRELAIIKSGVE